MGMWEGVAVESSPGICQADRRSGLTASPTQGRGERSAVPAAGFKGTRASSSFKAPSPAPNELQVGHVVDDRFKILDVINRGGMAWIYEALDRETGQSVALKVPFMQFECDAGYFSRFQREEQIGLALEHPCVVRTLPGPDKSRPYIVMEYLEGRTLADRLREETRLTESEAARVASRICEGLEYLHGKGVVHRDLKPGNVMLCSDGTIRIMDFGLAKIETARRLTFGGFSATMGSPGYIAPEQVQGKRGDSRSDIYALGAMLYKMTTGFAPFGGDNIHAVMDARLTGDPEAPRKRNAELSPEIEEIILHALERDPSNRFSTVALMKAELDNYSDVPLTERFKRLRPPQLWKACVPSLLPKIAALLGMQIAAFFIFYWWFSHHGHH
jgi:serine/threonine-protein kinase